MMNHPFYQQQDQLLTRRATEPVTLAPTASMIDPNLENHRIQQHPNLTTGYGQIQMQISGNVSMPHPQNNGHSTDFNRTLSSSAERTLPSRQVDESTIDDAYARYILYCNPTIPLDVDTTELRKGFRAPPKSDAKTFSPFTLYNLVSQLEKKEIKTWTELVLKLGVEPPDTSKNQSTQKVQQYAVRLKVATPVSLLPIVTLNTRHWSSCLLVLTYILIAMASCISYWCLLPLSAKQAKLVSYQSTHDRRLSSRA